MSRGRVVYTGRVPAELPMEGASLVSSCACGLRLRLPVPPSPSSSACPSCAGTAGSPRCPAWRASVLPRCWRCDPPVPASDQAETKFNSATRANEQEGRGRAWRLPWLLRCAAEMLCAASVLVLRSASACKQPSRNDREIRFGNESLRARGRGACLILALAVALCCKSTPVPSMRERAASLSRHSRSRTEEGGVLNHRRAASSCCPARRRTRSDARTGVTRCPPFGGKTA